MADLDSRIAKINDLIRGQHFARAKAILDEMSLAEFADPRTLPARAAVTRGLADMIGFAKAQFELANLAATQNAWRQALAHAKLAAEANPREPEYARACARMLGVMGQTSEASQWYLRAAKLITHDMKEAAAVLARGLRASPYAEPLLDTMRKMDPNHALLAQDRPVLIVEDDALLAESWAEAFKRKGLNAEIVADGAKAIEMIFRTEYLAAVVEVGLPGTTGVQLVTRIRESPERAELPVVFVSASRSALSNVKLLNRDLGARLLLVKPFPAGDLVDRLALTLGYTPPKPDESQKGRDDLKEKLAKLAAAYITQLGQKFPDLINIYEQAAAGDMNAVGALREGAHKLHGGAGTYGFQEIATHAGALEQLASEVLAAPHRHGEIFASAPFVRAWKGLRSGVENPPQRLRTDVFPSTPAVRLPSEAVLMVMGGTAGFAREIFAAAPAASFTALRVLDAAEAVEILRQKPRGVLVVDVDTEGIVARQFAVMQAVRAQLPEVNLPVIAHGAGHGLAQQLKAAAVSAEVFLAANTPAADIVQTAKEQLEILAGAQGRVIALDDDEEFLHYLGEVLQRSGFDFVGCPGLDELEAEMLRNPPDLLIVNYQLPRILGTDVARAIRASVEWRDIPIMFLITSTSRAERMEVLRSGADDLLQKPIDAEEIVIRVSRRIRRERLRQRTAQTDYLTRLLQRAGAMPAIENLLAAARREKSEAALTLIDIDRFKRINDAHGHAVGDAVLARLGAALSARFRTSDILCRWGGEEFLAVFPHTDRKTAEHIVQRFLEHWRTEEFVTHQSQRFTTTFTAGITVFPAEGQDLNALIAACEARVYAGKALGRDRIIAAPV